MKVCYRTAEMIFDDRRALFRDGDGTHPSVYQSHGVALLLRLVDPCRAVRRRPSAHQIRIRQFNRNDS